MRRNLVVYECSIIRDESGLARSIIKKDPKQQRPLKSYDLDCAKKEARQLLTSLHKKIRTLNVNKDGNIKAIIWGRKTPERTNIPGWVFKRPNKAKKVV